MIVGLLGTPSADDLRTVCEAARVHMRRKSSRPSNLLSLYRLSRDCDHDVVSLLSSIFVFSPVSSLASFLASVTVSHLSLRKFVYQGWQVFAEKWKKTVDSHEVE